jgi:hypothetical protein
MLYVRQLEVRHSNMRCCMFIRYRRTDVRHRMLSSYTTLTSYVLTCISYVHAYNIAYYIAYDIVCNIHSIRFGAGFGGFNWHAQSRMHKSLHGNVFIQALIALPPPACALQQPTNCFKLKHHSSSEPVVRVLLEQPKLAT